MQTQQERLALKIERAKARALAEHAPARRPLTPEQVAAEASCPVVRQGEQTEKPKGER